uniref:Transposase n=1 Tax=Candidatus Kentrum sp. TC TaxID=2126339 RepID=A0A450Z819_9GAMM|nr:MAG: hypothetical protein BECKTC1821E_GA0114239_10833 [Candidatus Kentron sp. TC]VFK49951.1 MAG: hypothetical protein BECKTC1821D_GA0114238_10854 [Candidatus Kentron sp. TC]VFK62066.1 MAG: hypothetical protein BECKTC1821F_GA0114240_10685 [Candidatus Kentron sp. TC]
MMATVIQNKDYTSRAVLYMAMESSSAKWKRDRDVTSKGRKRHIVVDALDNLT